MHYSTHILIPVVGCLVLLTPFVKGDQDLFPLTLSPNCSDKCGEMRIPYPFGMEEGCYYKENGANFDYYKITCDARNFDPPLAFLGSLKVVDITVEPSELRLKEHVSYSCYSQGQITGYYSSGQTTARYTISSTKNIFVAIGCDTYVWFTGDRFVNNDKKYPYSIGCMTKCNKSEDTTNGECDGIGCCQLSLPGGIFSVSTALGSFNNHTFVDKFNPCSMAFPVEKDAFRFYRSNLSLKGDGPEGLKDRWVHFVVDWVIGEQGCDAAQAAGTLLCKNNTQCYEHVNQTGYVCKCKDGFHGNPYHPQGCTDNDECKRSNDCEKPEYCVNDLGAYHCQCPKGYHGKGTKTQNCVSNTKAWFRPVVITAGGGGGIIFLLVIAFIFQLQQGKRQLRKLREMYFQQNGGLLLYQKLSGREIEVLKIFNAHDLEMATDNYADKFIIGRGGFGIVYKGTLPNNQHVAIKKSLKVDQDQVEQFINEVIVLSQINNRNVVKLLGCCLETEVPLLVYEYITNGTLYDHLEDLVKASILTWSLRLRIALDVANVLSYLHNIISTPIIHRDMKSMNILLDDNYIAKVADFGASRLVPEDQGQLATMVIGTWGYLDPEYMQTSELTEKSDVYSFGVVLVELLTRKKAISNDRPEIERYLAMHFLVKMKEGGLLNILDKSIVSEGTIDQIQQVANLAKWCLMVKGEDRPTMKEVAIELETINRKGLHPWNNGDEPFTEDSESLLGEHRRTCKDGGSSCGIDSNVNHI